MTFAIIISVVLIAGSIGYIAYLFIGDHRIRSKGRDIRVLVEDVRHISTNDSGAVTIRYRLSWRENGETKHLEGEETIPGFYSPNVQKGCEVNIRYLDDHHILFVFDQ
ncbi:hypothetical protein [Rhodococcus sp. W8901]|uniref:hypothetical protein n=1 Tax=Rhodococcus sp. W8901 TaxID=2742603 RepID=UPI001582D3BD|nr:hypothetical protein [Rhodococcus sp. W8901]QKT11653.1 hypothetical protein HUN07_13715 [Rhodococcus sp. W8901]